DSDGSGAASRGDGPARPDKSGPVHIQPGSDFIWLGNDDSDSWTDAIHKRYGLTASPKPDCADDRQAGQDDRAADGDVFVARSGNPRGNAGSDIGILTAKYDATGR